jgi:hypothetical protein
VSDVSEHPTRPPSNADVFARIDRLEDTLSKRFDRFDIKVDAVTARVDRLEGGIQFVKWLGPAGVAALIWGLLNSQGVL